MIPWMIFCLVLHYESRLILSQAIDLGHGFDNKTQHWVNALPFTITDRLSGKTSTGASYTSENFCTGTHGGTHLDAPFHFNEHGWRVGDIPLLNLIASGAVIDVSHHAKVNPDFQLLPCHIVEWEEEHGQLPNRTIILVDFGWSKFYNNRTTYFGTDSVNDTSLFHFPALSKEVADYLVDTGKVVGVGVDTPSVDRGQSTKFWAHTVLARANIYNLENMALSGKKLPVRNFTLFIMPMKITEGSGAPCRVVAVPWDTMDSLKENF
uniref:Cyclase n=1 Tax=Timema monikensis TaxID=170555 RepID=A0A7R9HV39_9NEOP|nr:unnamed protein product [Timema monikensis]